MNKLQTSYIATLSYLHVSAVQGNGAKYSEAYFNTLSAPRKLLTQQCATTISSVVSNADEQANRLQGGQV